MRMLKYRIQALVLVLALLAFLGHTAYAQTAPAAVAMGIMDSSQAAAEAAAVAAGIKQPEVSAQGACLMDASTGQVLFGKNQDTPFFPASITKVMTALLVLENCRLDDVVAFSASATSNLESGAVSLNISEGDQLTVEQALHGLLLKSANEIGNGLAEYVSGSVSAFAERMNERAVSLGCTGTHFANPHGLNDSEHITTAYDMCLILRAALQNGDFRRIDTTTSYQFPAVKNAAAKTITMGHKMMYPTDSRYYEGIIGGKTGYTSKAGNTLVTGVERNGVRLLAVVLKSNGTHYADTKAMLDYGFANYETLTGRSAANPMPTSNAASSNAQAQGPGAITVPKSSGTVTAGQGAAIGPSVSGNQAPLPSEAESQVQPYPGTQQTQSRIIVSPAGKTTVSPVSESQKEVAVGVSPKG